MSVILRCPTCGTTQTRHGECEACSEGEVRYFCTNHPEGIWLDTPVCNQCGARFGDAPRKPPAPPMRRGPAPPPAAPPDFRAPGGRRSPERPSGPDFGSRSARPRERVEPEERDDLPPTLGDLLEGLAAERARTRAGYEAEVPWPEPRLRRPGFPLVGCLFRAVSLVFLLIVAAIILLFLFFSGFIIY